jgi:hypothetical protein
MAATHETFPNGVIVWLDPPYSKWAVVGHDGVAYGMRRSLEEARALARSLPEPAPPPPVPPVLCRSPRAMPLPE